MIAGPATDRLRWPVGRIDVVDDAPARIDVEREQRLGQEVARADMPAQFVPSALAMLVGRIPFGAPRTRGARWFR